MSEAKELRQRRDALQAKLNAMRDQQEHAGREHSYALARDRAGVGSADGAALQGLADDEAARGPAIADVRRELDAVDAELASIRAGGLAGRLRGLLRRG